MATIARLCSVLGAALILSAGQVTAQDDPDRIGSTIEGNYGAGDPDVFAGKYKNYVEQTLKARNPNLLTVPLGFVKGVSRTFTGISGGVSFDLGTGSFAANISGLTPGTSYTLSLVDDQDEDDTSKELLPSLLFTIAEIRAVDKTALVRGTLLLVALGGATVDRVELRSVGKEETVLASGSVNLFQKLLFGGAELVKSDSSRSYAPATLSLANLPFSSIIPAVDLTITKALGLPIPLTAAGTRSGAINTGAMTQAGGGGGQVQLDKLISKGAKLFFEGTFQGNGRTCGTCHPLNNNLTIDPAFIATLPANNPLFVASFNFALAKLEEPEVLRQFALILENVDGLEDPINKRVMRSVPHTLGMQVSLNQDVTQIAPPFNTTPAEMTGWSGDGAPGAGSLRDFATGAVTQHFTKSLNRIPNQDFKLPKNKELDSMEAFQLSLGRDKEFDLAKITFNDLNVQTGKNLFNVGAIPANPLAGGRCAVCHNNAGANFSPLNPAPPPNATFPNRNFNTNVEAAVNPARALVPFPIDGGFGTLPANPDGSFGNRAFNTASVIEAADTPPFFHNNIANTLEGVVEFYNGPVFNGPLAPAARFAFNPLQVVQIAHFMRGINTLQNIELAARELDEVTQISGNPEQEMQKRLQSAFSDTRDGIKVLMQGGLYPVAVNQLTAARNFISQAQQPNTGNARRFLAAQAIGQLNLARATIASIAP